MEPVRAMFDQPSGSNYIRLDLAGHIHGRMAEWYERGTFKI